MDNGLELLFLSSAKSYTDTKTAALATGYTYKGSVSTVADLPAEATTGWMYTVTGASNAAYVYNGTAWVCVENYVPTTGGSITGSLSVSNGVTANLTGNVTGNVTGDLTGNVTGDLAGTASKATGDADGNTITTTYAKADVVNEHSKRLHNLEAANSGKTFEYQTDSTSAYKKTVPSGSLGYARLNSFGGKSFVWNQGVQNGNFTDTSKWAVRQTGDTLSVSSNVLTLTVNSTSYWCCVRQFGSYWKPKIPVGHKVLVTAQIQTSSDSGGNGFICFDASSSIGIVQTALTQNTFVDVSGIVTIASSIPTYLCVGQINAPANTTVDIKNVMVVDLTQMFGSGNEPTTVDAFRAMFPSDYYDYSSADVLSAQVQSVISKDDDAATLQTFTVPSAIKAMTGYGWSAGSVANTVDWENKKYIQRVARLDLGSTAWSYDSTYSFFYANPPETMKKGEGNVASNMLCGIYDVATNISAKARMENKADMTIMQYVPADSFRLHIKNSNYTDASAFRTAMNGVYLYYELATPVETDISSYLSADNFLTVEAGGSIEFTNQLTNMLVPVPSNEKYSINLTSSS